MDLAILVLASVALVVLLVAIVRGRRIEVAFGRMSATVEGIDRAVNQRPEGEPRLSDDVRRVREDVGEMKGCVQRLSGRLDEHLAYHRGLEARPNTEST